MTDEQIIKALECCSKDDIDCEQCPANGLCDNDDYCFTGATLDLINSQKAEIERLQKAIEVQDIMIEQQDYKIKSAKIEAIKEYKEKVKAILMNKGIYPVVVKNALDEAEKEMKGGE